MDDLDIYGDLESFDAKVESEKNTEELAELRSRYEALLTDHEHLQTENARLKETIGSMKSNFRSLMETARAEVDRKDRQIQELRKERDNVVFRRGQSGRIAPHSPAIQPPIEKETAPPAAAAEKEKNPTETSRSAASKDTDRQRSRSTSRPPLVKPTNKKDSVPPAAAEKERDPKETSRRAERKDSDRQSGQSSCRRQSHDTESDRDRDRSRHRDRDRDRGREDSSRRSRDSFRDRHRSNRSSDRSRERKRGRRDDSRDRNERSSKSRRNESPQRVQSQSKRASSSSSSSRSNSDQPSKRARLEAVQETNSRESPAITEVKTEVEEGEKPLAVQAQNTSPFPVVTEPKTENPTESPLTSFTGSLERLKKGLLNTEREPQTVVDTNHVLPIVYTAPVPASKSTTSVTEHSLNSTAISNHSTRSETVERSQEMAENTLQISAEIKSSPASNFTDEPSPRESPSASFEIIAPIPKGKDSEVILISESTSDNIVEPTASDPNALHPHMTVILAEDHLPMMVIPKEAVVVPAALPNESSMPSTPPPPPPPPPPSAPKPKIQMLSANRNPHEDDKSKPPSNLTVAHLQERNKEQERNKLHYLREEILRVAGPEVANDPQLLSSFKQKEQEQEQEQKRLKDAAQSQVIKNASSVTMASQDADILVVDAREGSTIVAPEEDPPIKEEEKEKSPVKEYTTVVKNESLSTPTADKCIIMGNTKYNYTQDLDGNKIMVVSRIKKKKRPSVAP